MIGLPSGVKVYLACGRTDMRKGMDGLALQVEAVLQQDPFSGHVFCFRGRRGDLLKALYCGTRRGCACSPSGWRRVGLCGPPQPTGWSG